MTALPKLRAPEVNDFENPTFERREAHVRRWAADLPVLNLTRTVPELGEQLPMLVREPLAPTDRLRLLELFRTPVNSVLAAAENRRLRQTPISSSAKQRIKDDVLALTFALADGYKVALLDLLQRGKAPAADRQVLLCLQRALEQLRNALFHAYRIYRAVQPNHFLELHQLHLYAQHHGVEATPVPEEGTPAEDRTPQQVYLRALLLAVADPFRLVDGAIEELYRFLGRHTQQCRLKPGLVGDPHADGCFLVRADSDLPPALYGRAQLDRAGEVPYTLDAGPLMRLLEQAREGDGEGLDTFAKWLLPRFKVAWQRAAPRHQVNKKARVAGGLDAACFLLSPAGQQTLNGSSVATHGIEVQELEDEEATAHTMETWRVANESLNGFMLTHAEQAGLGLRVGDLALIVVEGPGAVQPVVAVVRWMGLKDGNMQCGVEILPGRPAPIRLEPLPPDPEQGALGALYLPAVKQIQSPPTLVTAKGLHQPLRKLVVDTGSKRQGVSCGEMLTTTEYLDRFRFGRAELPGEETA